MEKEDATRHYRDQLLSACMETLYSETKSNANHTFATTLNIENTLILNLHRLSSGSFAFLLSTVNIYCHYCFPITFTTLRKQLTTV